MNPDNLPYFQLFIDEWFASPTVISMSRPAQALYMSCLMRQWQRGFLPGDTGRIRRLVGWDEGEFQEAWKEVEGCFDEWDDGNLRNEPCERKRAKYVAKVANGSRGGRPTKKPKPKPKSEPNQEPSAEPKPNPLSLSLSPSLSTSPALFGEEGEAAAVPAAPIRPSRWTLDEVFPEDLAPWLPSIDSFLEARTSNKKATWAKGKRLTPQAAKALVSDLRSVPEGLRGPILDDAGANSWLGLRAAINGGWLDKNQGRAPKAEAIDDEDQIQALRDAAERDVDSRPVFDPAARSAPPGARV